jgi:hypothetical protein
MNLSMFEEFFKIGDFGDLFKSYLGSFITIFLFYSSTFGASLTGDLISDGFANTFRGEFLFSNS